MKTMKVLALGAVTALTFSIGAMAQVQTTTQTRATAPQAQGAMVRTQENTVQYGSSDRAVPASTFHETDFVDGGF